MLRGTTVRSWSHIFLANLGKSLKKENAGN